ncbi:MAG TPA: hypothetical protein VGO96_05050, partial [Pyrinomonadaceae bacterium]|nr:hypothetical protein [Pyrinomonadaceae bacterium]
ELWHTPEGDAYGSYVIGAHIETSKLTGRGFKEWLEWKFYNLEKRPPTAQGMNEALGVLSGVARFDGVERRIYTRVAEHAGTIYIDLCDPEWRIVAITSEGWSIVEAKDAPVRFRRAKGMLALPEPVAGGDISELRNFVNVRDDADFTLLSAWLVAALRGGAPNFPVLSLTGEQGSAKSTTARVLRFLVDPNQAALRSEQRNGWDLAIAASNSWCIALDNLSALPLWLSDALCRVSTGGGFATRAHYENDEETIFDATRPILLNGIEDIAARADLLDRAIVLHLPTIPEHARRDESAFWMEFAAARPRLFGVLCDAVATAQRNLASVRLERLPRMADFAKWATAAESALGCAAGGFLTAYVGNRKAANDLALEASPVASALISLMDERNGEPLTITLKSLLKTLNDKLDDVKNLPGGWPKDARGMSGALARCAPTLRAAGWDVQDAGLDPKSRQARRTIAPLENSCFHPSHPSHPSQDSKNAGESAKDSPKDESLAPFATTLSFAHPSQESPAKTDVSKDAKGAKDEMQTSSDAPLENGAESSLSGHNQSDCGYEELEEIAERAAIMEFDGGLSSEEAEQFALNQEREF